MAFKCIGMKICLECNKVNLCAIIECKKHPEIRNVCIACLKEDYPKDYKEYMDVMEGRKKVKKSEPEAPVREEKFSL